MLDRTTHVRCSGRVDAIRDRSCALLIVAGLLAVGCRPRASHADGSSPQDSPASAPLRTPADWLQWEEMPPLPDGVGLAGALVGVSHGALVVAGGSNFPIPLEEGGEKAYRDAVYVLEPGDDRWRTSEPLPRPIAQGAAASVGERIICVGGRNSEGVHDSAFLLEWDARRGAVTREELPSLPEPCCELAAAAIGQAAYVAAGMGPDGPIRRLWRLSLDSVASRRGSMRWQELPAYPAPARSGAALVAQSNGEQTGLYLMGGRWGDSYLQTVQRFDPGEVSARSWRRCADMPRPAYLPAVVRCGSSHLFALGGSTGKVSPTSMARGERFRFPNEVFAYHAITDTWVHAADMPQGLAAATAVPWNGGVAIPTGETRPGQRTPVGMFGRMSSTQSSHFGAWDYATIAVYLLIVAAVGIAFSGKTRSTSEFFLGGRRIPWWAAGLSLLATQVSSVGAMAIPAKSYATDWTYFAGVAAWFVVVPVVTTLFIPFFRRLDVTSAYEYLEARFNPALRLFGSVSYSLLQLGRMAVVLYLPALALASVTGIDVIVAVLVMGALCTIYTMAGGVQAVIWTDVLQAGVLAGGMLLCLVAVMWQLEGGLSEFLSTARATDKLRIVHPRWDAVHASLWVVLIGNVFIRLSVLTSDQAVVQRYLTTRDESQSRKALWADVAVSIPWALLVFSLGTALFVFYRVHPHLLSPAVETDGIVPFFVAQQLPAGISGLVVAAIMAASMSSMDSSMHSIATLLVTDVYAKARPAATEEARFRAARQFTALLGVMGTASAVALALADVRSLWDFFQYIMGLFVGSLAGLFLLGAFTTRGNSTGALVGAVASAALLAATTQLTSVHFLLYSAIGVVSCFVIGYVASLLLPGRSQTDGLTAYSLRPES